MNCQYHANGNFKCNLVEGFAETSQDQCAKEEKKIEDSQKNKKWKKKFIDHLKKDMSKMLKNGLKTYKKGLLIQQRAMEIRWNNKCGEYKQYSDINSNIINESTMSFINILNNKINDVENWIDR